MIVSASALSKYSSDMVGCIAPALLAGSSPVKCLRQPQAQISLCAGKSCAGYVVFCNVINMRQGLGELFVFVG